MQIGKCLFVSALRRQSENLNLMIFKPDHFMCYAAADWGQKAINKSSDAGSTGLTPRLEPNRPRGCWTVSVWPLQTSIPLRCVLQRTVDSRCVSVVGCEQTKRKKKTILAAKCAVTAK